MRLFLPSFICVVLLIIHSIVFRGKRITLAFFGWCYIIKAFKALCDVNSGHPDYFPLDNFLGLSYKGIPYGSYLIVVPVGWIFAHYISWCIAEAVLYRDKKRRDAFFPTAALSIFGTMLVGLCMECVNDGLHWWQWETQQTYISQYILVWGTWSVMFFYFFFTFFIKGPSGKFLKICAFTYIFLFFASFRLYNIIPSIIFYFYESLFFAQIPLYFLTSVKLHPLIDTKKLFSI